MKLCESEPETSTGSEFLRLLRFYSEFLRKKLAVEVSALACEDGNSKLVEVVTVVEVDDEKRVDNSLVQIWKVNFGHKVKFLFGL